MTYDINGVTNCLCRWIKKSSVEPELLSLTLAFGIPKELNYETPSLLIGVASKSDIENWKKEDDFLEYIWNQAEYTYYEIEQKCINDNFFFKKEMPREYFIKMLSKDKNKIISRIYEITGYKVYIYIHDLDNHDIYSIISDNFDASEIQELKKRALC